MEHFNLQLTHPYNLNPSAITITKLESLIKIYDKSRTLPEEYLKVIKRKQDLLKVMTELK